jgi:hypothetical protein
MPGDADHLAALRRPEPGDPGMEPVVGARPTAGERQSGSADS